MPYLVRTPTSELSRRLTELNQPDSQEEFLEATMAASAFVAMADGVLHPAEVAITETLRSRVHELETLDPHVAAELYAGHLEALESDAGPARERILEAVRRVAGRQDIGHLLIQVCLIVAVADRVVSRPEYDAICELVDALGLDIRDLEA